MIDSNVEHQNVALNVRTGKEIGTRTALKPRLMMRWTTTENSRVMLSVLPPHIPSKKVCTKQSDIMHL
jgi:hypothetical protein